MVLWERCSKATQSSAYIHTYIYIYKYIYIYTYMYMSSNACTDGIPACPEDTKYKTERGTWLHL